MMICKVTGDVVAPQKNEHLADNKLLIVQPLDLEGKPKGSSLLALDLAQAGPGDLVLVTKEGGSARIAFNDEKIPLQAFVVGIIDGFEIDRREPAVAPPKLRKT